MSRITIERDQATECHRRRARARCVQVSEKNCSRVIKHASRRWLTNGSTVVSTQFPTQRGAKQPSPQPGEAARPSPRRSQGDAARPRSPRRRRGAGRGARAAARGAARRGARAAARGAARPRSPRRSAPDSPRRRACLESEPLCKTDALFAHLSESFEQRYLNIDPTSDVELSMDDMLHVKHRAGDVRLIDGTTGTMPSTYASSDEDDVSVTDDSDADSMLAYSDDEGATETSNEEEYDLSDREGPPASEDSVYESGSDAETLSHVSVSK